MDTSIATRAMLATVRIRTWSACMYDRAITREVCESHGAGDGGRFHKQLVPSAPEYQAMRCAAVAIRRHHYIMTLPWSDGGWRLLPTSLYDAYSRLIRSAGEDYDRAAGSFLAAYPRLVEGARASLGTMWRQDDYPAVEDLRSRIGYSVRYAPIVLGSDIRVDLPESELAAVRAASDAATADAIEIARRDTWRRLYDVVCAMHARLSQPDCIYRDTVVTNVRDVCRLLQDLNVTRDPALELMRAEVERTLGASDPSVMRDDPAVRASVAAGAASIMEHMRGVLW